MTTPLVTIAIPFFNNQATLAAAVFSVLNQTFKDWELILIDDGSSDGSLELAKKFSNERVTVVSDGRNKGLVARLNQSVALARGKYYARMDSDDIMHPERLARQVAFLNENPGIDVVDTPMYVMDQEGVLTGERNVPMATVSLKDVLLGRTLNHATVMGRLMWFKKNPYDPVYVRAEDVELWCRTAERSGFARLDKTLYFVREGKIRVRNYMRAQSTLRLIYKTYGPRVFDGWGVRRLILSSHLKSVLYRVMGGLGLQELLTNLRNRRVDQSAFTQAEKDLTLALSPALSPRSGIQAEGVA